MSCSKKVIVLLATYNGQDFLEETVLSIVGQTHDNLTMFIRDDGSADNTNAIIDDLQRRFPEKIMVAKDDLGNLGCPASFYKAATDCGDADYYAFADQDDTWLPTKIEYALQRLSEVDKGQPCVYCSSFEYCLPNGEVIRRFPTQSKHIRPEKTLFYTPGLGFTIVFNHSARKKFILENDPGDLMHDRWMLRCGAYLGTLIYDPRVTARHIRHEEAVTASDRTRIDLLKGFIENELDGEDSRNHARKIRHFKNTFKDELTKRQINDLELLGMEKSGFIPQIQKCFYPHRLKGTMGGELAQRLLFLLNRS